MKLPIPDDWDEISWLCILLQWPDSQKWRGLLNGALSLYTRGRYWDESTGTITDVQAIGWEIFDRNVPYTTCDTITRSLLELFAAYLNCVVEIPSSLPDPITLEFLSNLFDDCLTNKCNEINCGCDDNCEEDCMSSVTNLKCEDGKLWMERCCTWIEVCDISTILGSGLPPDYTPPVVNDPRCQNAGALAKAIFPPVAGMIADIGWRVVAGQDNAFVTNYEINHWTPLFALEGNIMADVILQRSDVSIAVDVATLTEEDFRCAILDYLNATDDGDTLPPDALSLYMWCSMFYSYLSGISANAQEAIALVTGALNASFVRGLIVGLYDDVYDCTCGGGGYPLDPEGAPTVAGWFLTAGLAGSVQTVQPNLGYTGACFLDNEPLPYNCWGVAFDVVTLSGSTSLSPSPDCADPSGLGGGTGYTVERWLVCHPDVSALMIADGYSMYQPHSDSHFNENNVILPSDTIGTIFGLGLRGQYDVGFSAFITNIRFVSNENNLGI